MDSNVGSTGVVAVATATAVGSTVDATSGKAEETEIILPKNASEWLAEEIKKARKMERGLITLPATATARDIGLFLKHASKAGLHICREGGVATIVCFEEGKKLLGKISSSRTVVLPDSAFDVASALAK